MYGNEGTGWENPGWRVTIRLSGRKKKRWRRNRDEEDVCLSLFSKQEAAKTSQSHACDFDRGSKGGM